MSVLTLPRNLLAMTLMYAIPLLALVAPAVSGNAESPPAAPPATASAEAPSKPAGSDAGLPDGIAGAWKYGSISPLWVKDLNTGMFSTSQSMGSFYDFAADGTFKHFVLISFNNSGWKNGTFTEEYGNASFDPKKGTVTLTLTHGKYRVMDNRVQKNNYTRDMTAEEVRKHSSTVRFRLTRGEDGKPRLELGHASNNGSTAYTRWEEK